MRCSLLRSVSLLALAWIGSVGTASAQNLIANPGFENNPPPAFGNNIGYPIAPWTLGPGQTSNVVKVDGGATFNYGNAGPRLDADPSTGIGVQQHYLDIASGANAFYQSFTVPACGGAPGQTRIATFSGWFSTRDNLAGSGSIAIRQGTGISGTVLASASAVLPSPPLGSGLTPWVFVSGSVSVAAGSVISYVVDMDNNANFDDASLLLTGVTCVTSQFTLEKAWIGAVVSDTASVTATRASTVIDSLASTANSQNEVDTDPTPVTVFQGETITVAETLGVSNLGQYGGVLTCTGATLAGSTVTVGSGGLPIVCRFTNTRTPADLRITKTNTPGINGNVDQAGDTVIRGNSINYSIVVANAGPGSANGAVLRDPAPSNLVCSAASCTVTTGGAVCPSTVTIAALQAPAGLVIPTMPANSSLTFSLTCTPQ